MAMRRSIRSLGGSLAAVAGPSCRCGSTVLRPSLVCAGSSTPIATVSKRLLHATPLRWRDESYDLPPHRLNEEEDEEPPRGGDAAKSGSLRNEYIKSPRVRLVDPETNELIDGLFETRQLLQSIDRTRFALVQVAAGMPRRPDPQQQDDGEDDKGTENANDSADKFVAVAPPSTAPLLDNLPICKLVNTRDEYAKARAAKKAMYTDDGSRINRSDAKLHKEVILTWHSTMHDRQHKLQPLRSNLIKRGPGSTCKVIVSTKKGNRKHLTMEEKQQLLLEIEQYLCDWSDAHQVLSGSDAQEGAEAGATPTALAFSPRRRGDVDWKKERQATLTIEVIKK